jgi:hypothetical protein
MCGAKGVRLSASRMSAACTSDEYGLGLLGKPRLFMCVRGAEEVLTKAHRHLFSPTAHMRGPGEAAYLIRDEQCLVLLEQPMRLLQVAVIGHHHTGLACRERGFCFITNIYTIFLFMNHYFFLQNN